MDKCGAGEGEGKTSVYVDKSVVEFVKQVGSGGFVRGLGLGRAVPDALAASGIRA